MGTYEYQRMGGAASEMISDVLLQELQESARYQHVYSLRSDSRGDYVLRGRLYDFRRSPETDWLLAWLSISAARLQDRYHCLESLLLARRTGERQRREGSRCGP